MTPEDLALPSFTTGGDAARAETATASAPMSSAPAPSELGDLHRTLAEARDDFISRFVASVLEEHGGNREAAAAALGISVRSLYRYLSRSDASAEDPETNS